MLQTAVLIVAAGKGERAQSAVPKQYHSLAGKPVLRRAIEAFLHKDSFDVRVVYSGRDQDAYRNAVKGMELPAPVSGGATRQESVRLGLEALAPARPSRVLIHDAARPLVSPSVISRVLTALDTSEAAAPMLAVADTLRRAYGDGSYEIVPRDGLWRAQTPQGFHFEKILKAHRDFAKKSVTDDIQLAELAGMSVARVLGEETNMKLTTPDDMALAEKLALAALGDIRTGTGIDAHGFTDGDHVWLCGIKVPHDRGLAGHSDADVGLHALTDAILATIAAEDIGAHFPPSEARWRGAPSYLFLEHAASMVRDRGGVIAHADVTIICERPKVSPLRDAMREKIAEVLKMDVARVSVKATTTDGLGFTGRREGIAAQAVATVRLPS